jgi:hypothetical protein
MQIPNSKLNFQEKFRINSNLCNVFFQRNKSQLFLDLRTLKHAFFTVLMDFFFTTFVKFVFKLNSNHE